MALTVAQVATPTSSVTEGTLFQYKIRMLDLTADTSYPTGGYSISAASIGFNTIVGAWSLGSWANAGRTQHAPLHFYTNAAQTSLSIQLVNENDAAAYAQRPKMFEAVNASSQTGFAARVVVIGT